MFWRASPIRPSNLLLACVAFIASRPPVRRRRALIVFVSLTARAMAILTVVSLSALLSRAGRRAPNVLVVVASFLLCHFYSDMDGVGIAIRTVVSGPILTASMAI